MFSVAGVSKLAGGDTGSEPYRGKRGQERWQKMRENVIREWEAEQEMRGVALPDRKAEVSTVGGVQRKESEIEGKAKSQADGGHDVRTANKDAKSEPSTLHKLKDKLFKH